MTTHWTDYELLDFGAGRKLERFGTWILDRPCPTAVDETPTKKTLTWAGATARYDGSRATNGKWTPRPEHWPTPTCILGTADLGITFELAPLPSGQVGIFSEQFKNWQWISQQIHKAAKPVHVLNLFAYTGGSTMAAALAGANVTHVDASKSMVARARRNAELSQLAKSPIRWIVEDALKFCQRELKRGNKYDAIILDPPSYGHGPKGEAWSIRRDLLPLLEICGQLSSEDRKLILCTCHTPDIGPAELNAYLSDGIFGHCGQPPRSGKLFLQTAAGRKLSSGIFARWPA